MTIPKQLRERLGIRPGETLEFEEGEGGLIARKVADRDPVDELYGILALEEGTDAFVADVRGDTAG